jgi:alcohol dehydrogenase class IV
MSLAEFQHVAPPLKLFSGERSLGALSKELEKAGSRRAVVICGRTLGRAGSALDHLRAALGDRLASVFDGVAAHSPVDAVEIARDFLRSHDADAVIAVGGGSAIVTARAAAILLAEGRSALELATRPGPDGVLVSPRLMAPKLPQFIVPTTPTTAMVKAGSALFDPDTGARLALFDPKTRAQVIAIHPALITSAPLSLMISSGLNTFAMAVEGLVSKKSDPLADAQLIHALRLLTAALPCLARQDGVEARSDLMAAAVLCGRGSDHSGAGITTVLGHAVGARSGVENGHVNAVVLPHALRFNGDAAAPGLAKVAAGLGLAAGADLDAVVGAVVELFDAVAAPRRLRDLGVDDAGLPALAEEALNDWFLGGNPRPVRDAADLQHVLSAAW